MALLDFVGWGDKVFKWSISSSLMHKLNVWSKGLDCISRIEQRRMRRLEDLGVSYLGLW